MITRYVKRYHAHNDFKGTSPAVTGTPEEEIGYIAADEYSHRLASPPPESKTDTRPVVESPLRTTSIPATEAQGQEKKKPPVIHVDEPYHHLHHPDGFAQTPGPDEVAHKGIGDDDEEEPILAADEVRPESAYQHAAVSPTFQDYEDRSRTPSVNESRSNSRATSHRGSIPALARYNSRDEEIVNTPLEDVEEYEPLFPEDGSKESKPLAAAEVMKKRPDTLKHRFPSEDIWEDSPNSHQLHATVSTPDIPKQDRFETPEQEEARKAREPGIDSHQVAKRILDSGEQEAPTRPGLTKQRFPSRDIWEDAPESQTLVTTIEPSEEKQLTSPEVPTKPILPRRPEKRSPPQVDASTKPTSPVEKRQPPVIPDRPKPQIPTRPGNRVARAEGEETQAPSTKPKPAVPARPTGGKIASIKAGFLSDLNSRLQLGPPVPPKPQEKKEAPVEKGPLSDARKGRARGPARRKPAVEKPAAGLPTIPEIKITETWNVWQVREDGSLTVGDGNKDEQPSTTASAPERSDSDDTMTPPLARNMSSESADSQIQPKEEEVLESPSPQTIIETSKTEDVKEEPPVGASEAESSEEQTEQLDEQVDVSSAVAGNADSIDAAAESLAASADGKRLSDGDESLAR